MSGAFLLDNSPQQNRDSSPHAERHQGAWLGGVIELAHGLRPQAPAHITVTAKQTGRWFLFSDIVALACAFIGGGILAWLISKQILGNSFQTLFSRDTLSELAMFTGLGAVALLQLERRGHYSQRLPFWETAAHILSVTAMGVVLAGFLQFAIKSGYSRLWLSLSGGLFAALVLMGRHYVMAALRRRNAWNIPALIIGDGVAAEAMRRTLQDEPAMGYHIVGKVPASMLDKLQAPGAWARLKKNFSVRHLFIALDGAALQAHQPALKALARERLSYSITPPWHGLPSATLRTHHFMMNDMVLLDATNMLALPVPQAMKRCFDIGVAGLALLVLFPFMLGVALFVRRDGGPALFVQRRVGRHGKLFNCYKFRSMRVDAEKTFAAHLASDAAAAHEWQTFQKLKHDPRVTKFGAWLRRCSIDELPQLFNVLCGDMSLVGPRPILPGQESRYGDDYVYYDCVRPGITGPWQVSGRSSLSFAQRVELEAWYAKNWSLWMDVVIILKTIAALRRNGQAY